MPMFDAGDVVDPLEYNFDTIAKRYPGKFPELEGVEGITDEPSDEAVQRLQHDLQAATAELFPDEVDMDDRAAVAQAMRGLSEDDWAKAEQNIIDAVARLTNGKPSREQIAALPFRVRRKYVQWLQRELMNPEHSTVATNA